MFLTKKTAILQFVPERMSASLAITTATEQLTTSKSCLCKTSDFAGKFEQLVWTIVCVSPQGIPWDFTDYLKFAAL